MHNEINQRKDNPYATSYYKGIYYRTLLNNCHKKLIKGEST